MTYFEVNCIIRFDDGACMIRPVDSFETQELAATKAAEETAALKVLSKEKIGPTDLPVQSFLGNLGIISIEYGIAKVVPNGAMDMIMVQH